MHILSYDCKCYGHSLFTFNKAGVEVLPLAGVLLPALGLRLAGVRATFFGLASPAECKIALEFSYTIISKSWDKMGFVSDLHFTA